MDHISTQTGKYVRLRAFLYFKGNLCCFISDLSPTVVKEWKAFLDKELDSPNLYYAAFDFCNMPFKDNSIDIISDGGGIGNAEGDKAQALKEAYRVLKPGGLLVTSTGFVNKETLAALSEETQTILMQNNHSLLTKLTALVYNKLTLLVFLFGGTHHAKKRFDKGSNH